VEELYYAFREALERSGENTKQLSREKFERFLQSKAAQLRKSSDDSDLECVVAVEDGRARLKVRVKT